jgi:hypothetical protein
VGAPAHWTTPTSWAGAQSLDTVHLTERKKIVFTLATASCGSSSSLNNTYFLSRSTIPWHCPFNTLVTASCGSTTSLNNTYFMSRSTIPWHCPKIVFTLVTASCGSSSSLNNTYFMSRSTIPWHCPFNWEKKNCIYFSHSQLWEQQLTEQHLLLEQEHNPLTLSI